MVALSLRTSKIPQKGDTKTEKTYEHVRDFNNVHDNFPAHLRSIILRIQRWLGVA
jgi:hypothetical protein